MVLPNRDCPCAPDGELRTVLVHILRETWLVFPSVKDSISFLTTNLYYICYHTASVSCFDSLERHVGS